MTFLNWAMLLGLTALAVPILIHLLNRRQAKLVDWGAMQFLLASLTTRKRNIMIEEIILMAIRCLLVALLALAMARPFLPARSAIPWAVVLPAVLAGALAVGIAAAMWWWTTLRWLLVWSAVVLFAIALIATLWEQWAQRQMWKSAAGEKDVAIVIDGSASMTLRHEGKTNFARAVEEARSVVRACKPGDAVSVVVAGAAPREAVASPTSDREEIAAALDKLKPVGGSMQVLKAFDAASAGLDAGRNPAKKIVLITDGQKIGWNLNDRSWRFLARGFSAMPVPPQIILRKLDLPQTYRNVAVADLTLSRLVVGTDRPVKIDVKVENTGTEPVTAVAVKLSIDGEPLAPERVEQLPAGAAETVHFRYRFERPGPHVLEAQALTKDTIDADNAFRRVVDVIDRLRVLIVDGAPGERKLSGAKWVRMALAPGYHAPATRRPRGVRHADQRLIVEPRIVRAAELRSAADLHRRCPEFGRCALVILSNVPRLSREVQREILRFVERGGGLLILPGDFAQLRKDKNAKTPAAAFYADWKMPNGKTVAPAALVERLAVGDSPVRPALRTFSHPALALVGDEAQSDLPQCRIKSYWRLSADEKDRSVRVAALTNTGEPLMVERKLSQGEGYVLMTAMAANLHDSNLPLLRSFVTLMHEVSYFLAAPVMVNANVSAGANVTLELQPREGRSPPADAERTAKVTTPSGRQATAALAYDGGALRIRFAQTEEPGTYRVALPKRLAGIYPTSDRDPNQGRFVPLVVLGDPAEGRLAALKSTDLDPVRKHVALRWAKTYDELAAAVSGDIPGEELWRWLAVGALLALVGEIALTRWIAMQRKAHEIEEIDFGAELVDLQTFRARARELLAEPQQQAAGAR